MSNEGWVPVQRRTASVPSSGQRAGVLCFVGTEANPLYCIRLRNYNANDDSEYPEGCDDLGCRIFGSWVSVESAYLYAERKDICIVVLEEYEKSRQKSPPVPVYWLSGTIADFLLGGACTVK